MCATVCPSQALTFGPPDVIARQRAAVATRDFRFGQEHVQTKVFMMMPASEPVVAVNVEDYMERADESEGWLVDDASLG
jgi:hypothetical protein